MALALGRLEWVRWALELHKAHGAMVSSELLDWVESSAEPFRQAIRAEVSLYLTWWNGQRASRAGDNEQARAQRLTSALEV
jgi:hypothetical protein